MKTTGLLAQIRSAWLQRVASSLARADDARNSFGKELEHFYVCLEQAVTTGNPDWLNPILIEWTESPTLSDLTQKKNTVSELLNKIIAITNDVAVENLSEQEASIQVGVYFRGRA